MTDQDQHPTAGRSRRHKSPAAAVPIVHEFPLPRLLDHMGAEDGPSEAEEEKKANRHSSASNPPRSTAGTLPHDYDMVMGIAPVDSQESVRFEEGDKSEFQDVLEANLHNQENLEHLNDNENNNATESLGAGEFHGRYGSASL